MKKLITLSYAENNVVTMPYSPGVAEELAVFHSARHMSSTTNGEIAKEPFLFFRPADDLGVPVLEFRAGLAPLIETQLRNCGYSIQQKGRRPHLPQPNAYGGVFRDVDHDFLAAVWRHEQLQVRYAKGQVSPAKLIAQVAHAWPKQRLLVIAKRVVEVKRLSRQLREWLPNVSHESTKCWGDQNSRVMVATPFHADYQRLMRGRDIIIATHAAEFVRQCAEMIDGGRLFGRCIGFLPAGEQLAPFDRDQVLSLFGPHTLVVPRHGTTERPIDVIFSPIFGGNVLADFANPYDFKRRAIWHHPIRNRRLGKLAKTLAAYDLAVSERDFPRVNWYVKQAPYSRIGVVVENVEHALALGKKLSEWPIIAAQDCNLSGIGAKERAKIAAGRDPHIRTQRNAIITTAGLQSCGHFDILIRADAGTGPLTLPTKMTISRGRHASLLIIDSQDKYHPALRRNSRSRRAAYLGLGWHVIPHKSVSQLDQFIATRPLGVSE